MKRYFALLWFSLVVNAIELNYSFLEERPAGTYIANIARDSELSSLGPEIFKTLTYKFLRRNQPFVSYFTIDATTGILSTAERIDREDVCPAAAGAADKRCVIALDIAVQPVAHFTIIKVSIEIKDINDLTPTFERDTVDVGISEAERVNYTVPLPIASDGDTPANAVKGYSLEGSDDGTFGLRTITLPSGVTEPQLVVLKPLDRESRPMHRLLLVVRDGGVPPRSGSVVINVTVIDANDHCPTFERSTFKRTLPEDTAQGTEVARLTATDRDSGPNGRVLYRWDRLTPMKARGAFQLNEHTGAVSVWGTLDFEEAENYALGVVAYDQASPPCEASATLDIKLTDVNDNAPEIVVNTLSDSTDGRISEYAQNGTFVVLISASDRDGGDMGRVTCSLPDSPQFDLEPMLAAPGEYQLVSRQGFDRERQFAYFVTVQCSDAAAPPATTDKQFRVLVVDENDNAPQFVTTPYERSMAEGNVRGAVVMRVLANDADTGANSRVTYALSGPAAPLFAIDPQAGIITALDELDAEAGQLLQMTVIATDGGSPPLSGSEPITIHLLDVNDNAPLFDEDSYSFIIGENEPAGSEVGEVSARDVDVSASLASADERRRSVRYHFDENMPDHDGRFVIGQYTGKIVTAAPLDRERKSIYRLAVIATDAGTRPLDKRVDVTVRVRDVNDNGPVVQFPTAYNNTVYLSYLLSPGSLVTRIIAFDPDDIGKEELDGDVKSSGEDKTQLVFDYFQAEARDKFVLNKATGQIRLGQQLAPEDKGTYRLVFSVSDGASGASAAAHTKIIELILVVTEPESLPGYPLASEQQNLLIVIILAATSAVVSICIIVLIIVVKSRADRQAAAYNARSAEQQRKGDIMKGVELVMDCDDYKSAGGKPSGPYYDTAPGGATYYSTPGTLQRQANHLTTPDVESSHSASSTLLPAAGNSPDHQVVLMTGFQNPPQHHYAPSSVFYPPLPASTAAHHSPRPDLNAASHSGIQPSRDSDSNCDSGRGNSVEDLSNKNHHHLHHPLRDLPPSAPGPQRLGGYTGGQPMQTFSPARDPRGMPRSSVAQRRDNVATVVPLATQVRPNTYVDHYSLADRFKYAVPVSDSVMSPIAEVTTPATSADSVVVTPGGTPTSKHRGVTLNGYESSDSTQSHQTVKELEEQPKQQRMNSLV